MGVRYRGRDVCCLRRCRLRRKLPLPVQLTAILCGHDRCNECRDQNKKGMLSMGRKHLTPTYFVGAHDIQGQASCTKKQRKPHRSYAKVNSIWLYTTLDQDQNGQSAQYVTSSRKAPASVARGTRGRHSGSWRCIANSDTAAFAVILLYQGLTLTDDRKITTRGR